METEGNELPIFNKEGNAEDLGGLPVLKKKAETLSAQSTTPSSQSLENAPTLTTAPLTPTNQQSLPSPSLPVFGTSASGPSILDVRQKSNVDRVESIKNKTREVFLSSPTFADSNPNVERNKQIYFDSLKKYGYSDNELADMKAYGDYVMLSRKNYANAANELSQYNPGQPVTSSEESQIPLSESAITSSAFGAGRALTSTEDPNLKHGTAINAGQQLGSQKKTPPTELTYRMANAALGVGKYDEAINFYTQTLGNIKKPDTGERPFVQEQMAKDISTRYDASTNPSNSLYGIGDAMTKMGSFDNAIPYFEEALKADPNNSSAQKGLAYAKYKNGDRTEYKEHLNEAAKLDARSLPSKALAGQLEEQTTEEVEQDRRSKEVGEYADMIEAFATGDREGKLGNIGLLNPIGKMVSGVQQGALKSAEGVKEISHGEIGAGAADVVGGVAHAAFSSMAQAQAFNTAIGAINETAKRTLSDKNAKMVEEGLNIPFTAASHIAAAIGIDPKEGSSGKKYLDLLDTIVSFGAMHAVNSAGEHIVEGTKKTISDRIKSFDDLKSIMKEAAEGKLSDKEMEELRNVNESIQDVTPKDVLQEALKNPELKADVENAVDANHKSPVAKALEGRLVDLQKAVENPEISPETKADYQANIDTIKSQLDQLSNTETTDHVMNAESQIKITDINDHIDLLQNDLKKAETNTEKELINTRIKALETEKAGIEKDLEASNDNYIQDVHAVANPGSVDFYTLAESALSDPSVVDRVKASLEKAATDGLMSPEEAQAQLDSFRERIPVQESLNPALKEHPELAMKVIDLAKELESKEEDLTKTKGYIGAEPDITIQNKERSVQNTKDKIASIVSEAKDLNKEKTKEQQGREDLNKASNDYVAQNKEALKIPDAKPTPDIKVDDTLHKKIAEAYDQLKTDNSSDPVVAEAYNALVKELNAQFDHIFKNAGVKVEFSERDPYANSKEMMKDILENKRLKVFSGGNEHPFLGEKTRDEAGLTANDKFRAVHDYVHAKSAAEFGKQGEEKAWVEHSKMFSPEAQRALSTETRGQNAWFHFGGKNTEGFNKMKEGKKLIKEGKKEEGEKLVKEAQDMFQFAEQKVDLLPEELTDWKKYEKEPRVEPPKNNAKETETPEGPEDRKHAIWKRVVDNIKDEDLKAGLEKEGLNYLVKKDDISESSARDIINGAKEAGTLSDLEKIVLDDSNKMDPVTRGVVSAILGKDYFDRAELETDSAKKSEYLKEFFKYTDKAAALATEGGQIGNAIGKIVKKMYANNSETIVAKVGEFMRKGNEQELEARESNISETYAAIRKILETPEGKEIIDEKIKSGVESEVDKINKKLSPGLRKQADKAIAALDKIQKSIRMNNYSSVPVAVIDTAITTIKLAIKAGVGVAEAVEMGIDKVKELHDKIWEKESDFRKDMLDAFKKEGIETSKKKEVPPDDQASILDAIEKKAGRLKKENKDKFLKDVIQEVEKNGGLTEERFKDMYAEALGLKTMTPELIETIQGYAKIINEGVTAESKYLKSLDDITDAKREGDKSKIDEAILLKEAATKEMLATSLKAKKANDELSNMMKDNKKLSDTLIGMMQLGALTPASIIKNISAMPAELAFRALSGHIQGAADYLLSGLANVGLAPEAWKERQVDSIARMQGAWYAHPRAVKNLFDTLLHGSFDKDFQSREVHNKIEPVRAFQNLVSGKSNKDMSAIAANFIEALPQGYIAAAMGRALAGPDAFFRTVAEIAKAYELGTLDGKKEEELEKFMFDPPKDAAEKIKKAGDEMTFQQDNVISEFLKGGGAYVKRFSEKDGGIGETNLGKAMKGALKVIAKSQALYIKTPTNVFGSVLRMVSPEYSALRAAGALWKGDKVAFSKYMADVAVGSALRYVIVNAIKHNMVTPTVQYNSKEGKAQGDETLKHGGKFNRSAFTRMISGGDWHEQDDDIWVDYSKWTGGLGVAMGAYASMLDGMPKEDMDYMTAVRNSYKVLPTMGQQVLDLSFMSTTSQLIDALKDSEGNAAKKWTVSTVGTLATPLLPNTVTTPIKASSETKKSTYSPDLIQNIINDLKYKLTGGGDLPSKITLWGEPVTTAPKGSNKYIYYLFDVVRAENPDENSIGYKTMELYRKTGDKRVIPTQPSNQVTIGDEKVTLDGHQFEQLQRNIGSVRKSLVQDYMKNGSYNKDDDNMRAYKLDRLYGQGHKMGIQMTIDSDSHLTSIKNNESKSSPITGNRKPSRRNSRPQRH